MLALGLAHGSPAWSQATGSSSSSTGLEEIVVTATRRSESLSKVPISVTALDQNALTARGVKDFQDIARYTPGVSIDQTGTNAISIRGISSSGGAGTTGIYLDDTPVQMRAVGFNPDDTLPQIFDLERIEILRGPQGTLFGAGSEGGTVRYIQTAPRVQGSSTYIHSEVSMTSGGDPSYEVGVAHGDTLIDGTLGWRGSAWYRKDGGWVDRFDWATGKVTEENANYSDAYVLRLAALWQPTEALAITPGVVYQNSKEHDDSTYWPAYSNADKGQFRNATPERMPVPDEYWLPSLKIEYGLGKSQIISNTSYYSRDQKTGYQGTAYDLSYYQSLAWPSNPNTFGLPCGPNSVANEAPCDWYPLLDGTGIHMPPGFEDYQTPALITNKQRSFVQEIRWQSTDDTSKWRWTVGAFYQQTDTTSIEELRDEQVQQLFQELFGTFVGGVFGPYYSCNGHGAGTQPIPDCDVYYNGNKTTDEQIALYGEVSYALTDRLRLTVGDRVARTSFSLENRADGIQNFGPSEAKAEQDETPNTPKVGLSFQLDDRNLFYGTYAKGYRVGGGNAPLPDFCDVDLDAAGFPNGAPITYDADSTQNFEIGSKNNFGEHFRIATSLYYIEWSDIQQNVYVGGGCGLQFTDNLGKATAKGFDVQVESTFGPMSFDLAVGYTDARYTESTPLPSKFCPSDSNIPCSPLANDGDAISGQASINLAPGLNPPWTVAFGAQYDFTLASKPAFVRLDYQYASRNDWPSTLQDPDSSQFNSDTYTLPATEFAQLRGGITLGSWSVALFIDNLFDSHKVVNYQLTQRDFYTDTFPSPTPQENRYTFRPRTIGLTASLRL
jgi:outer membrane receptor protein involved in Fe transport